MKDIATCTMTGTLVRDAEQRQDGIRFGLKCTETIWDGKNATEYESVFSCRKTGKVSDNLMQYLVAGRKLTISCRPRQIGWTDSSTGEKKTAVVFMVGDLILGSAPYKDDGNGGGYRQQPQQRQAQAPAQPQAQAQQQRQAQQQTYDDGPDLFQDDRIPF